MSHVISDDITNVNTGDMKARSLQPGDGDARVALVASRQRPAPERASYHHGDARSALLAAAAELVREHGPAAFSMREAARRVGVDPATCYRHFKDRHALLMAIAQSGFEELARRMGAERRRRSRSSPRVRLIALGPVYLGYALEQPAYFRVMFGESGTTARDQRLRLPSVQRSAYEQLEDELTLWAEAEGLRADVPRLALKLWAGMHGLARLAIDGAVPLEKGELRRLGEEIGEAIVDAAVADAGGPRRGARRPSDRGR